MDTKPSVRELAIVRRFLRSASSGHDARPARVWTASFILVICGLVLGGYATMLFLSNPTDHVAGHVLLPGGGMGFLMAMFGALIPQLAARSTEKREIAVILQKLLSDHSEIRMC